MKKCNRAIIATDRQSKSDKWPTVGSSFNLKACCKNLLVDK